MPHSLASITIATTIAGTAAWGTISSPKVFPERNLPEVSAAIPSNNIDNSIEVVRSLPARTSTCDADHKFVMANSLNVRSTPDGGAIVGKLEKGTELFLISCNAGWAQIGPSQWVSEDFLSSSRESSEIAPAQEPK